MRFSRAAGLAFLLVSSQCAALTCDGASDASAQIQAAIDAGYGDRLELPRGVCVVTKTLVVRGGRSIRISGRTEGASGSIAGTVIAWRGPPNGPLLELRGVRDSLFENFTIVAETPIEALVVSATRRGLVATHNVWRNLHLTGRGTFKKGFAFVATENWDANNDVNAFYNVSVTGYSVAGWSFEHAQSKGHIFYSSEINGQQWGRYGVTTALGANGVGGSFSWIGGSGGNNSVADFYLGAPNDVISISNGNFEGSARFVETRGNSSTAWPILLQANRWAGNKAHEDGDAVIYSHRGPLTLQSNIFEAPSGRPLSIFLNATGPATGVAIGNAFYTPIEDPLRTSDPKYGGQWISIGNTIKTGPATMLPNVMPN